MDRLNNIGELRYTPLFITKNQSENNMTITEIKKDLLERLKVYRDRENACYEWSTGIVKRKPKELFFLDKRSEADESHVVNACCADEIDYVLELLNKIK